MGKKSWKRFRPNSNPELEQLLNDERVLTHTWYRRMSGEDKGERICIFAAAMEQVASRINQLLTEKAVNDFAKLNPAPRYDDVYFEAMEILDRETFGE